MVFHVTRILIMGFGLVTTITCFRYYSSQVALCILKDFFTKGIVVRSETNYSIIKIQSSVKSKNYDGQHFKAILTRNFQ